MDIGTVGIGALIIVVVQFIGQSLINQATTSQTKPDKSGDYISVTVRISTQTYKNLVEAPLV